MAGVVAVFLKRKGNKVLNGSPNPRLQESVTASAGAQDFVVNAELDSETRSVNRSTPRPHNETERQNQAALLIQRRLRIWLHRSKIRLHRKNLGDRLVFEHDLFCGFLKLMQQVKSSPS